MAIGSRQRSDASGNQIVMHDFKIRRMSDENWEIVPLSARACSWAKANLNDDFSCDGAVHTDLPGVNSFLTRARDQAFATEYCGPLGTAIF